MEVFFQRGSEKLSKRMHPTSGVRGIKFDCSACKNQLGSNVDFRDEGGASEFPSFLVTF